MKRADAERTKESSESTLNRFFTADNELFYFEEHTYALTKMWGADTPERVQDIIEENHLDHVRFEAISE